MVQNVEIISTKNKEKVSLGSTVTIVELLDGMSETYTIVGHEESDPANWKNCLHITCR